MHQSKFKTVIFTSLALLAFAANSVLCRLALGDDLIDAPAFTALRLLSACLMLFIIVAVQIKKTEINTAMHAKGSWTASFMLFLYAITFAYAYVSLDTGTGALILYGAVQISMILFSLVAGVRLRLLEWAGLMIAFAGLVYLVFPILSTPSIGGILLMGLAGVAWGFYTLKGSDSAHPLMDTAYNFFRTIPLVILLAIFTLYDAHYSMHGIVLAVLSGAVTSALGYVIWYVALRDLSSTLAAVLQLSVPMLAALGGVVFVAEPITLRLVIASVLVIGGVAMVVLSKYVGFNDAHH